MMTIKIGDLVCIRGLVHSDCFGQTGKIVDVRPSALYGSGVKRCKVDFNGRVRRLLSIHLVRANSESGAGSQTAA